MQGGGLPGRGPGTLHRAGQRGPRFVLETDPRPAFGPLFSMSGQVRSTHSAMASSSRSMARRAGSWLVQPIRCSSRHTPRQVGVGHTEGLDDHAPDPGQGPAIGAEPVVLGAPTQDLTQLVLLVVGEQAVRAGEALTDQCGRTFLAPGA